MSGFLEALRASTAAARAQQTQQAPIVAEASTESVSAQPEPSAAPVKRAAKRSSRSRSS